MHYVYKGPHKYRSTRVGVCLCVCMSSLNSWSCDFSTECFGFAPTTLQQVSAPSLKQLRNLGQAIFNEAAGSRCEQIVEATITGVSCTKRGFGPSVCDVGPFC